MEQEQRLRQQCSEQMLSASSCLSPVSSSHPLSCSPVSLLLLALATAALAASSAEARYPTDCCKYVISGQTDHVFPPLPLVTVESTNTLPAAQPSSPGDISLSGANTIVDANGDAASCNGDLAERWDLPSQKWVASFQGDDGQTHQYQHVLYINELNKLYISTLQTLQATLRNNLLNHGALFRIRMTCQNNVHTCVQFYIGHQDQALPQPLQDRSPASGAAKNCGPSTSATYEKGNLIVLKSTGAAANCRGDTLQVWDAQNNVFSRRLEADQKTEIHGPVSVQNGNQPVVAPVDTDTFNALNNRFVQLDLACSDSSSNDRGADCVQMWLGANVDASVGSRPACLGIHGAPVDGPTGDGSGVVGTGSSATTAASVSLVGAIVTVVCALLVSW
jgi:hypothetical protein